MIEHSVITLNPVVGGEPITIASFRFQATCPPGTGKSVFIDSNGEIWEIIRPNSILAHMGIPGLVARCVDYDASKLFYIDGRGVVEDEGSRFIADFLPVAELNHPNARIVQRPWRHQ